MEPKYKPHVVGKELDTASFALAFLCCLGLLANLIVSRVFILNKKLLKPANFFTLALLSVNFLNILLHMPFLIVGVSIQRFISNQNFILIFHQMIIYFFLIKDSFWLFRMSDSSLSIFIFSYNNCTFINGYIPKTIFYYRKAI